MATPASTCAEAGAVKVGSPATFSVVLAEPVPPKLSETAKLTVSVPPAAGVSVRLARSPFTCASVPEIVTDAVPLPEIVLAAPVSFSTPPASVTVTVKVSPTVLPLSLTCTPPRATGLPTTAGAEAGTPVRVGAPFRFSVTLAEPEPPRLSVTASPTVSAPALAPTSLSVASAAFTCASVPEIVSPCVPLPAAPVAFSAPPASVTETVKVSPVVLPLSLRLTPVSAAAMPASPCTGVVAVRIGAPLAVTCWLAWPVPP